MYDYSSQAYRSFKKFVGELTASAAGTQAALQHTMTMLASNSDTDPWSQLAKKHEIKVDGLSSQSLLASTSRLSLVSLYSGFDIFLFDFRAQYHDYFKTDWKKSDSDGPFDEIYRNARSTKMALDAKIHISRKMTIEYYRHVRNAVAHPKNETISSARLFYDKNLAHLDYVRINYAMKTAPNAFGEISFHDVKLLAKLLLDVLREVDVEFDPGNEILVSLIDFSSFRRFAANRRSNAIKGALKERFGVSDQRAQIILSSHLGP
jgi:hypothetical protein